MERMPPMSRFSAFVTVVALALSTCTARASVIPVGGFAESWSVSPSSIPADAGANAMILAASPYDLILPPFAADSFGVAVSYQPSQRWTATSIPFSFTSRPVTATATLTNAWATPANSPSWAH